MDNCPHCDANLVGDLIYDTFYAQTGNEQEALKIAAQGKR